VVCASKWVQPVSHDMFHHIVTHGPPIASKFRKLDSEKLATANAGVKQLEEDNIIQCSTFLGSSPSSHGEEGRWQLASQGRFPLGQPGDRA
jgi:hypothetical protein